MQQIKNFVFSLEISRSQEEPVCQNVRYCPIECAKNVISESRQVDFLIFKKKKNDFGANDF